MRSLLIRCIIFVAALFIIELVVGKMNARNNAVVDGESDAQYIVRIPASMKYVGYAMVGFGILAFFTFLIIRLRGEKAITIGLFNFALIFAAIGLVYVLMAASWKIEVDQEQMEVHRLFHRTKQLSVSEIERVTVSKNNQLTLYYKGKKLASVSYLCDNYDRLKTMLENCSISVGSDNQ